jgi:hypothetical protein
VKSITLTLSVDDVNAILTALADQPFKLAAGPISRITQQLQPGAGQLSETPTPENTPPIDLREKRKA